MSCRRREELRATRAALQAWPPAFFTKKEKIVHRNCFPAALSCLCKKQESRKGGSQVDSEIPGPLNFESWVSV